jgi:transporter, lysE family
LVTLVAQSAPLLTAVKIVGGLYLLYIGYKGLRSESCGRDGRNP